MARKMEEPVVHVETGTHRDETRVTHPAFGQITVSRIQGRRALYGSDFEHNTYVRITIYRSELNRHLSRDWPHQREQLMSVDMSEAQWATFVSSFGQGSGVQCTLERFNGEGIPEFPLRDEGQEYKVEQDKALTAALDNLLELRATIEANVQGLTKVKQAELLKNVNMSIRKLTDSMPFIAKSYAEHMEERVEKAKIEIHAYLGESVRRAGLEALGAGQGPLLLEKRDDE